MRVDNGPPDPRMPEFVRRWNDEGRPLPDRVHHPHRFRPAARASGTPTPSAAARRLDRPVGRRRRLERLRDRRQPRDRTRSSGAAESDRSLAPRQRRQTAGTPTGPPIPTRQATLFDEHTWGAYSSIEAPQSLFSQGAVEPQGGLRLHRGDGGARHRSPAPPTRWPTPLGTRGPKASSTSAISIREEAFKPSGIDELLVINTLPWERQVIVEEPEPRGGAAPVGRARHASSTAAAPGAGRGRSRRSGASPARCRRWAMPSSTSRTAASSDDLKAGAEHIENAHYRVRDRSRRPAALAELFDKALGPRFRRQVPGLAVRASTSTRRSIRPTTGSPSPTSTSRKPDFFIGRKDTPLAARTADKVDDRRAEDRRGPRLDHASRSTAPGVSSATRHLRARRRHEIARRRLDARQARITTGSGGGVHRLPVQARRAALHARPQRHPVCAQ